jgi:hypothetical protein
VKSTCKNTNQDSAESLKSSMVESTVFPRIIAAVFW